MRLIQDLIGPAKARELLFTARNIDGQEAERIGLVNLAVPGDRLIESAEAMAKEITQNSSFSIRMIKKGLQMAGEVSLEALMDFEVEACLACVSTKERQEALIGFEKCFAFLASGFIDFYHFRDDIGDLFLRKCRAHDFTQ